MPFDITWGWEVSGDPMSWTLLSHLRGSGLIPGRSTKTLSSTWLRKKGRKKEGRKKGKKGRKEGRKKKRKKESKQPNQKNKSTNDNKC